MGPWLVDVHTREEFDIWLGDDPPTDYRPVVMVVRGDSELVREFLPNALDAAKLDNQRVVAWLKDEALLSEQELEKLFLADETILAAVLSEDHEVSGWVYRDHIEVDDAAFAFSNAEAR
jgi:hypothetical protein